MANKKDGIDWPFLIFLAGAVLVILYLYSSGINPDEGVLNHKGDKIENINLKNEGL